MKVKQSIIIYHNYIPKVGGIESAIYNLAKLLDLNGYKVTICFTSCESYQSLFHYAEAGDVVRIVPDREVEADVCLIASNHDIPKQIKAKRFLQWVHSDYEKYKLKLKNVGKVEYIAVSNHASKVIKKLEGVESQVIYNLLEPDFGADKRRVLRLVTNSRVSPEKGFGRMLYLAQKLKDAGVRFVWTVYGDNSHYPNEYYGWVTKFRTIEEVQWVGYKSDVTIGLTNADYLVQLSDWEGCPYSVLEALKMGVPCLVTNWGGVDELIQDGKNGYILPMDLKEVDIDKIVNKIPKFEPMQYSSIDDWIKLLEKDNG